MNSFYCFQKGALEVASIVEGTLKEKMQTKPLLPSQMRRFREVQLPDSESISVYIPIYFYGSECQTRR